MKKIFTTIILLTAFLYVNSQAAIINVPADQPTIQQGIDNALESDTVLVAPGTYTGTGNRDLSFNGKNLVLLSSGGAETTIIDCQADSTDLHYAIYLHDGEDTTSIIQGFTFQNAYYDAQGPEWPWYGGGAVYFRNGKANVLDCKFFNNSSAGIYLAYGSDTTSCRISNCIFEGNYFGIYTIVNGTIIEDCTVQNSIYSGIGFYRPTEIKRCLFIHNGWAGISQSSGMSGFVNLVDHCTIAFNGIGIYYDRTLPKISGESNLDLDTTLISNTIVAYNTSGGIFNYWDIEHEYNCTYSNVYGNGNFNWQNDKYAHGDKFGNLSVPPRFCDTTLNNYYLHENSVCAIANNSSGSTIGLYDVGCSCCIGIRGNVDGDYFENIDISDLVALVDCMFLDCFATCIEEMDMNASGDYDISDLVFLVDFIFTGGPEPYSCN